MTRKSLLDDTVVEKARRSLNGLGNYGVIASKLKAIISAGTHGITLTAEVFDINRKTLTSWIKEVKNDKVDNLKVQAGRGRKLKVSNKQEEVIAKWLSKDSNLTIDKLKEMIANKLDINLGRATVHRLMQRLSFSYITPRQIHYKQDSAKHDEFKKKDNDKGKPKPGH